MSKYNLLPNDAIILATCKLHGITQLASHDTDFIDPCKAEGIELLKNRRTDLNAVQNILNYPGLSGCHATNSRITFLHLIFNT